MIGLLDSGIGGLSIWKEVTRLLPYESTVYIADSKNIPYGKKSSQEITSLASKLIKFLLTYPNVSQDSPINVIIVACNTITVNSLNKLRSEFPQVPLVGVVPVVKTAATISKNKRIGIFSTISTAESRYQKQLIQKFAKDVKVTNIGTNKLVPYIEKGEIESNEFIHILRKELLPFKEENIDVLALGCTHYPFIKSEIQNIMGSDVKIIDSGKAVANQVKKILENKNLLLKKNKKSHRFYTTGSKSMFENAIKKVGNITEEREKNTEVQEISID